MTEGPKDYTKAGKEPTPETPPKVIQKMELQGTVVKKRKGIGRKVKEVFFGGDFKTTMYYVAGDVVLPAVRDMIVNAAINGAKRMVYGERGGFRSNTSSILPSRFTMYNTPIDRRLRDPRETVMYPDQPPQIPPMSIRSAPGNSTEIVLSNKTDAEMLAERMVDICDVYPSVSVADVNEMLGLPSPHTANKYGWVGLAKIDIQQTAEGYRLELPEPIPLP